VSRPSVLGKRLDTSRSTSNGSLRNGRLGIAPHVADKILNHQSGTISGVAAVYQRHEFLSERKDALCRWGQHVSKLTDSDVCLSSRLELGRAA
jgi:hypothetical protein